MREIRPDFGAIFDLRPTNGIFAEENLFAWHSTLFRLSPARFIFWAERRAAVPERISSPNIRLSFLTSGVQHFCRNLDDLATLGVDFGAAELASEAK
jgi:hypothetical protein